MMIANISAFALARHWRHTPIYEALLQQDGINLDPGSGPHDPTGRIVSPVGGLDADRSLSQPAT
jgi:hypothetical protein